ncbi:MAG: hypothetical protein ACK5CY_10755 [Bacteroidia bacterium]|jgi:hypothetical protein
MNTPQKKGTKAKQALPKKPQKNEKEVEVTFVKHATEKPRIDIRNLPYSTNNRGDISIHITGNVQKTRVKEDTGASRNAEKNSESLYNDGACEEIMKRIKSFSGKPTTQRLRLEEMDTLAKLFLKAIAPPEEMVFLEDDSDEAIEACAMFENISDDERNQAEKQMYEILTKVSLAIGRELGFFMADKGYDDATLEIIDEFCRVNNLSPHLFTKKYVLSYIYISELIAQGCHPIYVLMNVNTIFKTTEASIQAILKASFSFWALARSLK